MDINPFSAAVPIRGQTTLIPCVLFPKRDCSTKWVNKVVLLPVADMGPRHHSLCTTAVLLLAGKTSYRGQKQQRATARESVPSRAPWTKKVRLSSVYGFLREGRSVLYVSRGSIVVSPDQVRFVKMLECVRFYVYGGS